MSPPAKSLYNELAFLKSENAISSRLIQLEGSCRFFLLDEVLTATNNFDDALVIGTGGFGKVYKGFIDNDSNKIVALKRLNVESKQGAGEFWTEVEMLSKLQHTHLVSLIGYCNERLEMILVYEYIPRGTLASHLYKPSMTGSGKSVSPLTWEQRLSICIGAARGLNYLHAGTNKSFIHRDVKTTNILLDDNWVAKICDFGLSKGATSHSITHVNTDVKGTFGYLDPEYFLTQRLTTKSDVYAFGVVLLEVLCGRPPVDKRLVEEQISLVQWAQHCIKRGKLDEVIDPSLSGQIAPRRLKYFVELAKNCLHKGPKLRPTMAEVLGSLEIALVSQQQRRTKGIMTKAFQTMYQWLRERKDNGSSRGQPKDVSQESDEKSLQVHNHSSSNWERSDEKSLQVHNHSSPDWEGSDENSLQVHNHSSPDWEGLRMFEGPGLCGLQIVGKAEPGCRLLAYGYPIRGTSLCIFQWVRHLQDGTKSYIVGATDPEYVVTADDVDNLIAIKCIPLDDQGRQGELVQCFANDRNKVTCDPSMQLEIDTHIREGQTTFCILLLGDYVKAWVPTTLILNQSGYKFKDDKTQVITGAGTFSKDLSIKITNWFSTRNVLIRRNGFSHLLKTYDYDARNRDTLVLTMRMFQRQALVGWKKSGV